MQAWSWILLTGAAFMFGLYMQQQKPECREGFTPIVGGFVGWYCAAGYRPQ